MKRTVHIVHFIVLFFILSGGIIAFGLLNGNPPMQRAIGIVTSLAYTSWGLIHHALQGDLHKKVVVEYILIGVIAILFISIVLDA